TGTSTCLSARDRLPPQTAAGLRGVGGTAVGVGTNLCPELRVQRYVGKVDTHTDTPMILPRTSTPELHAITDVESSATAASASEPLRLVESNPRGEALPLRSLLQTVLAELRMSPLRKARIVVKTGGQ